MALGCDRSGVSSCVLVSVIEGDAMSPDFIPSQPEGVYLYPFLQAPWPALGAGALPYSPVFFFTWLTSDTANIGSPKR